MSCHVAGGEAQNTGLVFVDEFAPGFEEINKIVLASWLNEDPANADVLLDRATGGSGHPQIIAPGSPEIATLTETTFLILTTPTKD